MEQQGVKKKGQRWAVYENVEIDQTCEGKVCLSVIVWNFVQSYDLQYGDG